MRLFSFAQSIRIVRIPSPIPNVPKHRWCACAGRDSAPKRIVYLCVATMFQITCIYFVATFFPFLQSFARSHVCFAGGLATFMTTTRSCNSFFFVQLSVAEEESKDNMIQSENERTKKKTRKKTNV